MKRKANFPLRATKGFHFPDGPYLEYEGDIESVEGYVDEMEKFLEDLVRENLVVEVRNFSKEEAEKRGLKAPPGKGVRTVNFVGFPDVGCGGTHVKSSGDIGEVKIRKISSKKGVTRVAYSLT